MKILLLGKTGQVGWALQRALAPLGEVLAPDRTVVDLEDLAGLQAAIRAASPEVIVNAAAYTAVDKAESEPERAQRVNGEAVDVIAAEAQRLGAWLLHYSTDYVFDGAAARPYREDDPTGPLSVYGRTKLAGEDAVRARARRHLIFRTSWVYAARGTNFPKTILRLAAEREEIRVVADQYGAPTGAGLLADASALALERVLRAERGGDALAGTYHVAAAGETTWYDYARYVLAQAIEQGVELKAGPQAVRAVATESYPLPAVRPRSSRLDTAKLRASFGMHLPEWRAGVARLVAELNMTESRR